MTVLGRYHDSTRIHDTAQSQSQVPGIIEIILCWPYDYDSSEIHNRRSRPSIMYLAILYLRYSPTLIHVSCLTLPTVALFSQVCHEHVAHNGTLASGESLSVSVWHAVPTTAEANPVCHFWCTKDGAWPKDHDQRWSS